MVFNISSISENNGGKVALVTSFLIRTMDSITDDGINGTTFPEFIRVLRFFLTQVRSRKSIAAVSIVVVTSDSERTSLPAGSRSHNLNKHLKQISGNNYI